MENALEESPHRGSSPLRRLSSQFFGGGYAGQCLCSPIWYGVIALALELLPFGITMPGLTKLKTDQFGADAYWIVTGSMVLQSLLSFPALAVCGYLSQPHRYGRKTILLWLSCLSTVACIIPALTLNAYIIVASQTLLACFAVGQGSSGIFTVMSAWATDWCKPEDKMTYFGILMGCLFGTISIAPLVPKLFHIEEEQALFQFGALVKLASPVFIAVVFPKNTPVLGDLPEASLARRFSASPRFLNAERGQAAQREAALVDGEPTKTPCKNISAALKYLLKESGAPTMIYIMINFSDAAVQDSIGIFLMKERHFTQDDFAVLMSMIGISGFAAQAVFVPLMNKCGVDPRTVLMPAVFAMVVHFGCYAFLDSKSLLIGLEPIGAFGYVAVISTQSLISGSLSDGVLPRDQGTLLGTLNGLKMLASCVGPFVLAGATSTWKSLPAPLNFAGVGFAFLSIFMVFAFLLSIALRCQKRSVVALAGDSCSIDD